MTIELPFGFEKPRDSPGFLLWQTTVVWQRLIKKALMPFGISHAQFVVMALLLWLEGNHLDPTQAIITSFSKLDKMTVSKSIKKLTNLHLIDQEEHQVDTRKKRITLTLKGKKLIQKIVPLIEKVDEEFFSVLSEIEQNSVKSILVRLTEYDSLKTS